MSHSQAGQNATAFILEQIEAGIIVLPMDIRLSRIAENTNGCGRNIGSAFDFYIQPSLAAKGYISRKCGTPRIIQLSKA
jgi:hypothetical protein